MCEQRPITWMGNSLNCLKDFPEEVCREMGYAFYLAQTGGRHMHAKSLSGRKEFSGGAVIEVVENYDDNTYRAAYTTKIGDRIYVLHAFQKKSKRGIATPKQDIDLIVKRLKDAQSLAARRIGAVK